MVPPTGGQAVKQFIPGEQSAGNPPVTRGRAVGATRLCSHPPTDPRPGGSRGGTWRGRGSGGTLGEGRAAGAPGGPPVSRESRTRPLCGHSAALPPSLRAFPQGTRTSPLFPPGSPRTPAFSPPAAPAPAPWPPLPSREGER